MDRFCMAARSLMIKSLIEEAHRRDFATFPDGCYSIISSLYSLLAIAVFCAERRSFLNNFSHA